MATNKKEAFRQYLEAAGVLDAITKSQLHCTQLFKTSCCYSEAQNLLCFTVLVSLYEETERPKNAIE